MKHVITSITLPLDLSLILEVEAKASNVNFSHKIAELCLKALGLPPEEYLKNHKKKRKQTELSSVAAQIYEKRTKTKWHFPENFEQLQQNKHLPDAMYEAILKRRAFLPADYDPIERPTMVPLSDWEYEQVVQWRKLYSLDKW